MIEHKKPGPEKAILVGTAFLSLGGTDSLEENLDELGLLARAAGADVLGRVTQRGPHPDHTWFIGKGKVQELAGALAGHSANLAIFDDDLSPAQLRNLSDELKIKVIDRSMLILDIFARHARTNEAKIQVELAQLNYLLPRLAGAWSHFGQQTGGVGTRRGPGETQLEVDRRKARQKIGELKDRLEQIQKQRSVRYKNRDSMFTVALAGYTNSGKSTLLNSLSKAKVLVADKLFATLDTTTRQVFLPGYGVVLLSDTVGFIRKLPHHLVASFKSTLEVITQVDLILHITDVSHPNFRQHLQTTQEVLTSMDTTEIPQIWVFNKADRLEPEICSRMEREFPAARLVSALKKTGLPPLQQEITQHAIAKKAPHPAFALRAEPSLDP